MRWVNLPVSIVRTPEYAGADPIQRATWLNILVYSCEQENSGLIAGCADWKCRRWQQTCGVTLQEIQEESELWTWEEDGLKVAFYPLDKEAEVQAKRAAGSAGGKRSGIARRAKKKAARQPTEAVREAQLEAQLEADGEAHIERKGREGNSKDKGKEGNTGPDAEFLEGLWKACPAKGRERSSRAKVATAWKNLSPRPDLEVIEASLEAWKESEAWTKDNGQFVLALDRWLRDRKFEIEPEPTQPRRQKKRLGEYEEEEIDLTGLQL